MTKIIHVVSRGSGIKLTLLSQSDVTNKNVFETQQITFVSSYVTVHGKFKQPCYIAKLTRQSGQHTGKFWIYSIM